SRFSVQARRLRKAMLKSMAMNIIGLRRPKRVRRRSEMAPESGPTKEPESGREMVMAALTDLERERRWR
ncbi:UNVERIFIED_CONTAM: hypothetical protein NY603_33410, partial [Bacteroidetes bacterium 56_B9]